ncbi:EAL domain-containing protein [Suttonella sp. R2A3]|uniref:EAL domain-containing protein n=1 Tax=Suttonella sp. R2A3 TaxID=2908648 RepID=UPI001F44FC16|nr:EAL domain-containing protein [Suttonella sp. R2A3]UJF24804.1 EAL domain-containing protein [Suttonella sp. R2A3]
MSEQPQDQTCHVLMIGSDMEWMHAYTKALQRYYIVEERHTHRLWPIEAMLKEQKPDVILLLQGAELPKMDALRPILKSYKPSIPVIGVVGEDEHLDVIMQSGVNFAIGHQDLLTAVRYTQTLMRYNTQQSQYLETDSKCLAVEKLYKNIYSHSPDPICYVQDGLFIDANTSFLNTFKYRDFSELEALTLLNLVAPKSEGKVRELLKQAHEKNHVPVETLLMTDREGTNFELRCRTLKVDYFDQPTVQLHFRAMDASGGGSATDPTTNLLGLSALVQVLRNEQKQGGRSELGCWIHLLVDNYREVWQKDGFEAAEILLSSVVEGINRFLPANTMTIRHGDDALIMWARNDSHETLPRLEMLIQELSKIVPEGIGRLVHPVLYAGLETIYSDTAYQTLLTRAFRGARSLSMTQSTTKIAEGSTGERTRKDERRVAMVQKIIDDQRILLHYQPITALEPDGVIRFADRLALAYSAEDDEETEIESVLSIAERYSLSDQIDRMKINTFLQDLLSYEGDQKAVNAFIGLSAASLADTEFASWILSQLKQTGISPEQMVFEISLDAAVNAFSGSLIFTKKMVKAGARIALSNIARLDDEVLELLQHVKPQVIKLDMREIDTFEDEEEERFMQAVKTWAEKAGAMIIVDHMESPAQLSHVWPYDLQYLQGDGMVGPIEDFTFNFDEPLF